MDTIIKSETELRRLVTEVAAAAATDADGAETLANHLVGAELCGVRTAGGAYLPFGGAGGGHKGYSIMLAVELLGRLFSGADAHAVAGEGVPLMRHQGVTMLLLRGDLFQPLQRLLEGNDALLETLRTSEPAAGSKEVLYPGLAEMRTRAQRRRDGIPLAKDIWQRFAAAAAQVGVDCG